jgi:hypothetical protein
VTPPDIWSIGIYTGPTPLELTPAPEACNPVLTAAQVHDIPAAFVADPFLLHVQHTWHMFCEVMHAQWDRGVIGLATSPDGWRWRYEQVVLQEPFHLSYPYVFAWQGAYYMVPETLEAETIRLYRAEAFPHAWTCVGEVLTGQYADPSLFQADGRWWMFVCTTPFEHDTLALYHADTPLGPWQPHPQNPLRQGDAQRARPGGRVTRLGDRLIRYAQDDAPYYGRQVRAFEITTLTTMHYAEHEIAASPILQPSGTGWNAKGMHHVDPHPLHATSWLASVDGHYAYAASPGA